MAKTLTPLDIHGLINDIFEQATGESALAAISTDDYTAVGELVSRVGYENTLGAISQVVGRMIAAARPYDGKLKLIDETDTGAFTQAFRKISFYSKKAEAAGGWNTQLYTNLADGFDNGTNPSGGIDQSTGSMWVQNPAMPLEMNFFSQNTWDHTITRYLDQLKVAFRGEEEFNRFISAMMVELANDIEQERESYRRMTLLSYLSGLYDVDAVGSTGQAINLTSAYNTKFSDTKTTQQLLTTNFKEFLEFLVSEIKQISNMLTYRTVSNHWTVPKTVGADTYHILRHTPKNRQKLILYRPMLIDAESRIFPEIFNPEFLNIDNYEGVDFWQSEAAPMEINVTPSIPDVAGTNNGEQTTGTAVNLKNVIGVIFDEDALWDANMWEDALTSPIEAKKRYFNTIYSFNHGSYIDYSEKGILLYMAD